MSNRKIEKFAKKEKIDKLIGIAEGKNIELAKEAIAALATIKKDESFNHLVVSLRNPNKRFVSLPLELWEISVMIEVEPTWPI